MIHALSVSFKWDLLLIRHLCLDHFQILRPHKTLICFESIVFKDENIKRSLGVTARRGCRVPESWNRDVHFEQLSSFA